MEARYFAVVLSLSRHALYAAAALPEDHAQRRIIRHQLDRLIERFKADGDRDRQEKLERLAQWFDDGAVVSTDMVVLSET
jgi:hypothetical protein